MSNFDFVLSLDSDKKKQLKTFISGLAKALNPEVDSNAFENESFLVSFLEILENSLSKQQELYDLLYPIRMIYFIGGAFEKAIEYFEKTCDKCGFVSVKAAACYFLWRLYDKNGIKSEIPIDNKKAFFYLEKSAELGQIEGMKDLSFAYELYDYLVEQDLKKSFDWVKLAAEEGDREAQADLGMKYLCGIGTEPNDEKALHWLKKGESQGSKYAKVGLIEKKLKDSTTQKDFLEVCHLASKLKKTLEKDSPILKSLELLKDHALDCV